VAKHRYKVNIVNPTERNVAVQLRFEPGKSTDLPELPREYRKGTLKIEKAELTLDPCAESGRPRLQLKLAGRASIDVYAIVETATAKRPGAAGLHVIDSRGGKDAGGVFILCVDPPLPEPAGAIVPTRRPCPALLADLYAVALGAEPDKANAIPVHPGDAVTLVALIAAKQKLSDTQVYLEHLGTGNAEFAPGSWNIGSLRKGDAFAATWAVQAGAWQTGTFRTSIVVLAEGYDATRLNGDLTIGPRKRAVRRSRGTQVSR